MPCEKCCRLRKRLKDAQEREVLLAKGLDNLREEVRRLKGKKSYYEERGRKRRHVPGTDDVG